MNRQFLGYAVLAIVVAILPFIGVYPIFAMKIMCYALFACAFNLLLGFTGLLSFGHAAFLGSAAYATGHALKVWGFPTEVGLLFGVAVAGLLGLAMGAIAIRRSGIYFAMITLALSQMVFFFFLQAKFTGGEDGLQSVPRGTLFGLIDLSKDLNLYYVVMAIFVIGYFIIWRTVNSPSARCCRRCAKTNRGPSRWATTSTASSCWPSCCRPRWPAWRAPPRPWSSCRPPCPMPPGRCPAWSS
jgi:branched-chain amino acid transport system permease protein